MAISSRLAAVIWGATLVIGALSGSVAAAEETEVALEPANRTVESGDLATYDVVVTNARGGVGSFDLAVTVEDPSVATVSNASYAGSPAYTHRPRGETSAQLAATGVDTADDGAVRTATVTLEAADAGTTPITLTVSDVGDESGRSYDVTDTAGATLSVSNPDDGDDRNGGDWNDDGRNHGDDESDGNGENDGDDGSGDGRNDEEGENDGDDRSNSSKDGVGDEGDEPDESDTDPGQDTGTPKDPSVDDGGDDRLGLAVFPILAAALVVLALGARLYLNDD